MPDLKPLRLGVNIDHVATVRNARGGKLPDPLRAAAIAAAAGADGITAHLRDGKSYEGILLSFDAQRLVLAGDKEKGPIFVVERGDTLVYCAGALADAYAELGGEVLYCGKPYAPIYEAALGSAAAFRGGERPPLKRVLAIGDSVRTDLKGAAAFGIDCVFITSGIHAEEYGGRDAPDVVALNAIFAADGVTPKAVMRGGLKW